MRTHRSSSQAVKVPRIAVTETGGSNLSECAFCNSEKMHRMMHLEAYQRRCQAHSTRILSIETIHGTMSDVRKGSPSR